MGFCDSFVSIVRSIGITLPLLVVELLLVAERFSLFVVVVCCGIPSWIVVEEAEGK